MKRIHPFLLFIIISIPLFLWAKLQILPTFDDWCTLSSPNTDTDYLQYFTRYGNVWRPFDALMGYIVGLNYRLFPTLNHIVIFIGHIACTYLVYSLTSTVNFNRLSKAIATTFFYISPCVLGTVLACDSLNQVYSQFWGLLAIWFYLHFQNKWKYILWIICVFMAALSKENGITWAVVPPIFAFSFNIIDKQKIYKHLLIGISIAITYFIIRMLIPKVDIFNPDYETFNVLKNIKGLVIWIGYTWFSADYISIVHEPSRNLPLFFGTLFLSLPFIYILFIRKSKSIYSKKTFIGVIICAIISISPNLLISLTIMNAYASLGMFAILVGFIINHHQETKTISIVFSLYLLSAIIVGIHHWKSAYESSLIGKEMAQSAIEQTKMPVNKVYCIIIEDDDPKFSSFCEIPSNAFGWGIAAKYETGYQWPKEINDTTIERTTSKHIIYKIAHNALSNNYDCVWIVDKKNIKVIK